MDEYDLFDRNLTDEEEDRILTRIRHEDPVHWDEKHQWWLVTRQSDIREVAKNPKLFSSEPKGSIAGMETHFAFSSLDGPEHDVARGAVAGGFKARSIKRLEEGLVGITDQAIDRVISQGHCDFARDIAWPVPVQVIAELLGFDDKDLLMRFAESFERLFDPSNTEISASDAALKQETADYVESLVASRRKDPKEDLISAMLKKDDPRVFASFKVDAPPWIPEDRDGMVAFIIFLLGAGAETTRHAISLGMLALLEHPDQMQRLTENPDLMPLASQEILRWTTPARPHRRVVMSDTELGGRNLKAGDSILMVWLSANRDEEVFEDPYAFRVDRKPNPHLTFGLGSHFCIGSQLAGLEVEGVIRRVLERMEDLRLAQGKEVVQLKLPMVHGLQHLPIEFRPVK